MNEKKLPSKPIQENKNKIDLKTINYTCFPTYLNETYTSIQ
jgi:hypothetical protein